MRRTRHRWAALLLLPPLLLGAAACGEGAKPGAAGRDGAGDKAKMREFAKCMRANGVDMPDPSDDGRVEVRRSARPAQGRGVGEDVMKRAQDKCRHLLPDGGKPRKLDAKTLAQVRAHAKCMREHGIDMPDPDENGRVTVTKRKGEEDDGPSLDGPDDPKFREADKACRKLLPGGGKGGVVGESGSSG
ncbi:hypothetical protein ACFVH6_11445 [Spirillospora sp. NPDC127200]